MTLSEELEWRGFINQSTLNSLKSLDRKRWIFYHGYDASSNSLTIGNLAALMMDKCFIRHGHKAVILAGGATSLIGDPGGKDSERLLQPAELIEKNLKSIKQQIEKLLGPKIELVNNLDWFGHMSVLDYLRDIGKYFSMTPLVQRDYITKRMGKGGAGISYSEFSYTILQGYDFLHLHKNFKVDLQLAGSDQWGNCISGIDLVRKVTGDEVSALTMPLIIDANTGKKFGKSEAGAIWLDAGQTSPSDFYQFWINTSDDIAPAYLKIFTDITKTEAAAIIKEFEKNKSSRLAQRELAYRVTRIVHGKEAADKAQAHASSLMVNVSEPVAIQEPSAQVTVGTDVIDLLVAHGLAGSKSEARRLIIGGAIYINNQSSTSENLASSDFINGLVMIRRGKSKQNTIILKLKESK